MEYRSPLGYNFKLEKSLSASEEEKIKETPKKNESFSLDGSSSRKFSNFDSRRSSSGRNSFGWQRGFNDSKSPSLSNSNQEEVPIERFYHPSMLENPWEELEKNMKTS